MSLSLMFSEVKTSLAENFSAVAVVSRMQAMMRGVNMRVQIVFTWSGSGFADGCSISTPLCQILRLAREANCLIKYILWISLIK